MDDSKIDLIEIIVRQLVDELKDKLECESEGNFEKEVERKIANSRSDLSIVNSQLKKLMETSSEDSSLSSSSSSSDDEDESAGRKKVVVRRVVKPVESSSDTEDDDEDGSHRQRTAPVKYVKTKDEVTIDELPPPEQVEIVLDEKVKLKEVGRVISRVDKLVVVKSTSDNSAPLDEETIIFDANRKSIAKIFEIFGPVATPFYSIRLGTLDEIDKRGLTLDVGALVYYAPDRTEYTKFIFNVDEMRREKGSDASWLHDNEPPVECLDYSDDEKEKRAKKAASKKKTKVADSDEDQSSSDNDGQIAKRSANNHRQQNWNNKKPANFNRPTGNNNRQPNYQNQRNNNWPRFTPPMNMMGAPNFNFGPQPPNFIPGFFPNPGSYQHPPPPLMNVGMAATGFNYGQQHPHFPMYSYPNPAQYFNHNLPTNNPSGPTSGANNSPNQVVDRRFIENKNYIKKKF